jgi:hypothetical protein
MIRRGLISAGDNDDMELRIIKYGSKMNSPRQSQRHLFVHYYCNDCNSLEDIEQKSQLLRSNWWTVEPPAIMAPWWETGTCSNCKKRGEYERALHVRGEYYWRRRYCMRHYLLQHLALLRDEDEIYRTNRRFDITITRDCILFNTRTANYHYAAIIERGVATLRVVYKGRSYVYTYRHHLNVWPQLSSYEYLLHMVLDAVSALTTYPVRWVKSDVRGLYWLHVYINGREVAALPPREERPPSESSDCPSCHVNAQQSPQEVTRIKL